MNQRELIRPDATIRYWTGGPDTAPTLMLLHGATLDHQAWDPQVDTLTP
jgi:pimeloyl-ACP methyl ester carboxylesterase